MVKYFHTRCAWAGGTCANYPDFSIIIISCYVLCYSCFYVLFFEEILIRDSRGFMNLMNNWPNLLGLCYFPLNT